MKASLLVLSLFCLTHTALAADSTTTVRDLRCEYRDGPLGVDVSQPRLSWILESAERGQTQTAYQVLVAASEESLAADRGDLWDSGKVDSDDTTCVVYRGKPLASHTRCYWKVKSWDKAGKATAWSQPGFWSMGLLKPSDWTAVWIGYDKGRKTDAVDAPLDGAKWIWHAADPVLKAPAAPRLFLSTLTLPADVRIDKAELYVLADDNYKFVINTVLVAGHEPNQSGWQNVRAVDVTTRLRPGQNELRAEVVNALEGPAGLLAKLVVTTADGKTITHVTDDAWKSAADPGANWHDRAIDTAPLPACRVLGDFGMAPWGKAKLAQLVLPPVAYLRTTFRADKPVRAATLYASALGNVDVNLNGKRVSDDYFTPGWTDYARTT